MQASTVILVLAFYPLLSNLPINFVRLQWSFQQGLAPMPREVQERAETADRMVRLVMYLILLAGIASMLHGSLISKFDVGLTTSDWMSALALGTLVSFVPVSLGAMLSRIRAADKLEEELESRGPLVMWCCIVIIGSVSIEIWRAFCIAALVRLDLSTRTAVLVVSFAYGAALLHTGIAKVLGAAVYGGVAGFLFVKTGSLLAPLALSLATMGAHLYQARHRVSRAGGSIEPLKCPVCSRTIKWLESPPGKYFTCPACGQKLRRNLNWRWQGVVSGIVGAIATLGFLRVGLFWSLLLFMPLFFVFVVLSTIFAPLFPGARTIEIYYDSHDTHMFRF
jgi:Type II CAAX prenyl endopeptidase Rce1-like